MTTAEGNSAKNPASFADAVPLTQERIDLAATRLLTGAREIAAEHPDGIEDGARQLVELSGGDVAVVSRARRIAVARMESEPSGLNKQIVSLIRRALEVGANGWVMHETEPPP